MADKTYKLTLAMTDGTQKSATFTVPAGMGAYEYAKAGGYTGTEEEFAAKMAAENLLVVTGEDGTTSHNSREIYTHIQNGGTAVFLYNNVYYNLANCSEDRVSFVHFYLEEGELQEFTIYEDKYYDQWTRTFPNMSSCVVRRLLWENPNPYDEFEQQTVTVGLDGYDGVEIVANNSDDGGCFNSGFLPIGAGSILSHIYSVEDGIAERWCNINTHSVYFNVGYVTSPGQGSNPNGYAATPYRIYGIKHL